MKITIPENKDEIYLKDYQNYMKIAMDNEDNIELLNIKAVEIFCNMKMQDVKKMKVMDFNTIVDQLSKTLSVDDKFIQRFELNGVEYGFFPKIDDIDLGEYIDADSYLHDIDTLHKAMAVMYRPITFDKNGLYLIEDYKGSEHLADIMKFAPLSVALGAQVFFYNLSNDLLKHTMAYLEKEGMMNTQVKQILEENGDGIKVFTHLLEGNYLPLIMSQS